MREATLAVFDKIVAANPNFERKGKTMPYTSANGYMFSQVNKAGELGIRLPKARGKQFIEEHDSGPFLSYGAVMRDYVRIPEAMLQNEELVAHLLQEGFEHVMTLPPK